MRALAENPWPAGSKKLVGEELWRIRTGNYRVIYSVENQILVVEVLAIGHRKYIYKK
ncbi:MAG: type II toxin-antitoxin system RelE/ParE family toxin [Bacteroidetes bacterium]|nr:type II toxin-antitoxin system RelE/ParE family toxin [Bacteroidota bacterium]MDA1121896.1 type II toxin-antitoxin system RelE/ParE family toxin [Bacteroidota bacterium]